MRLRKLEEKDAPLMLEWMHDPDVVENLNKNFAAMTMDDCKRFIVGSADTKISIGRRVTQNLESLFVRQRWEEVFPLLP